MTSSKTERKEMVSIKATYWIVKNDGNDHDNDKDDDHDGSSRTITSTKIFDASNTVEARVGLPVGSEPVKVRGVFEREK
jgi:hypothetical protein